MDSDKITRKERAQQTRQNLVDAAIELFTEKGYDQVTVDDICGRAGVSKGAFYGHFKSKDQAVVEEYLRVDDYYREMLPEIIKEKTYLDKAIAFIRVALGYIADQGKMVMKVAYSTQIAPRREGSQLASQERALYVLAEALIKEAQKAGEVREDMDSSEIANIIIRSVRGLVYDWCLQDGRFDLQAAGDSMAKALASGLLKQPQ